MLLSNVSCYYQDQCKTDNACKKWTKTSSKTKSSKPGGRTETVVTPEEHKANNSEQEKTNHIQVVEIDLKCCDSVAVLYENSVYIGCIVNEDEEFEVNFMEFKKGLSSSHHKRTSFGY